MTLNDAGRIMYRRTTEEDRWIAPHIPELIDELDCHIHVDVVASVSIFTYLYKYLYKGPDHTSFHIPRQQGDVVDETKDYVEGRYLSTPEAAWRILGFHITSKTPSVLCLPVHLPDGNIPRFAGALVSDESMSLLIRYFNRPTHPRFDNMLYCDYFKEFVLYKWTEGSELGDGQFLEVPVPHSVRNKVCPRQVGTKISRMRMVSPTSGELFYVRCLLARRPARNFAALRNVDGVVFKSFHEAAIRFGLFTNENEGHYVLIEAVQSYYTPFALRFLFSRVILEGYPARPLWDEFKMQFAQDFIITMRSQERGLDEALKAISENVHDGGHSLTFYGLPEPVMRNREVVVEQETYSGRTDELRTRAQTQFHQMNDEQKDLFTSVVDAATNYVRDGRENHRPFFLEGKPGRGKTFVVDAICSKLRSLNMIVLIVGSSALAATLYEGGRTAHNVFQIPVIEVSYLLGRA